jgi:hypothetical protein
VLLVFIGEDLTDEFGFGDEREGRPDGGQCSHEGCWPATEGIKKSERVTIELDGVSDLTGAGNW